MGLKVKKCDMFKCRGIIKADQVYQSRSIDTSQKRKKKMAPHHWLDKDMLNLFFFKL